MLQVLVLYGSPEYCVQVVDEIAKVFRGNGETFYLSEKVEPIPACLKNVTGLTCDGSWE